MFGRFRSGVWVKNGDQIINVSAMQPDYTLQGIRVYVHDNGHQLLKIIDAEKAQHQGDGHWVPQQCCPNALFCRFDSSDARRAGTLGSTDGA